MIYNPNPLIRMRLGAMTYRISRQFGFGWFISLIDGVSMLVIGRTQRRRLPARTDWAPP